MTPEEIAALRRMATTAGLVSLTGKELSALLLERDHHAAEAKALREAAGALADAVERYVPGCGLCATEGKRAPVMVRQGPYFACDEHGEELDDPKDLPYSTALRGLCALLGRTP